jgi:histidine triad (HIT) family protein
VREHVSPEDCIFCRIVSRAAPAHVVFEDDRTLAFLDIFPVADGHTLVIPKHHCSNLLDAEGPDLAGVIASSKTVAQAIRTVLEPDGIAAFQFNGAAAGQTVFHYHMHLVPRRQGDTLQVHGRCPGDPGRLAETARRLAAAIAGAPPRTRGNEAEGGQRATTSGPSRGSRS